MVRALVAVFVLLVMVGAAHADPGDLAPYRRLRWEATVGASGGSIRDARVFGFDLEGGVRTHRLAFAVDYRRLDEDDGVLHRLGAVARYNLALCCDDRQAPEAVELFFETGAAIEALERAQGTERPHADVVAGVGLRLGGIRWPGGHKLAFGPRIDVVFSHPPARIDILWNTGVMLTWAVFFGD